MSTVLSSRGSALIVVRTRAIEGENTVQEGQVYELVRNIEWIAY